MFLVLMSFMFVSSSLYTKTREFYGYAYDRQKNTFLYSEHYTEFYEDNKHIKTEIVYRDPEGKIIGKKVLDFSKNPSIPVFEFRYYRNGYTEGSFYEDKGFRVYHQDGKKERAVSRILSIQDNVSLDSGIHRFIQMNFQKLLQGEVIVVNFAVPSRLDFVKFRLYKTKEFTEQNRKVVRLHFEIDNSILRLFVPPIVVDYDAETKDLLKYTGISNLYDESNKPYQVIIIFRYP